MALWLLEQYGLKITLAVDGRAAEQLIESALAEMRLQPISEPLGIILSVAQGSESPWLLQDSTLEHVSQLQTCGDLIYHLSDRIVFHIADKVEQQHCLHAAAVMAGNQACVIPAKSGAGKSSLTAWMVANGFAYITDELIVVDQLGKITGVARPIQIKPKGLQVIQPLLTESASIYAGQLANAVTASMLGGEVANPEPANIGLVLFPQFEANCGFQLQQLSSAEAGMRLMSNHVNARNLKDHGFRAMMKLIRETSCYSLEYGGFDQLPADFALRIATLMR